MLEACLLSYSIQTPLPASSPTTRNDAHPSHHVQPLLNYISIHSPNLKHPPPTLQIHHTSRTYIRRNPQAEDIEVSKYH